MFLGGLIKYNMLTWTYFILERSVLSKNAGVETSKV